MSTSPTTDAPPAPAEAWHTLPTDDVLDRLGTSTDGLGPDEAARRLAADGPNELTDRGSKPAWRILYEQVTAVMVLILIGASLLSLALGKFLEAGAIGAIVVLFAILGFVQEHRAEQAIAALRRMAVPSVRAVRDGRQVEIAATELVRGDLVALEAGSVVPADVRLVEAVDLAVQEAALTGESEPVEKSTAPVEGADVPLGDRRGMAYSGTQVTAGRAVGVVVAPGMATELGRIADLLQGVESEPTPLQSRLDTVGTQLAGIGLVVALRVVAMGVAGGEELADLVLTAISVAVAVIPEGLPAVVTFTLAIGAQRMLRREALIRKLPAVETLGSVTVICSDKTGTLTENRMTATVLDIAGGRLVLDQVEAAEAVAAPGSPGAAALAVGVLCNDGDLRVGSTGDLETIGDPTETALLLAAHRAGGGGDARRTAVPRTAERPFDSDRKRMSTVHGPLGGAVPALAALPQDVPLALVKGAVDGLLGRAAHVHAEDGVVALDDGWRQRVTQANDALAADGMRVLGVAYRELPSTDAVADAEEDLVLLGLVGIIDPPRAEVRDAVATCRAAGIRPVMITGDHPLTARAIATELGIAEADDRVVTGVELERMTAEELDAVVVDASVFARVSPEHKLRIVDALQRRGDVVAMTGDCVNDAPALKRADIGVAMGITGTDVSKEAADVVLRDDNFSTIVAAVEEGRVIYDNLRRFVSFAVAGNLGKIIVMLGWPLPFLLGGSSEATTVALLPLQLLWLNLMTDGLLGLSMGMEPAEPGVMRRGPHAPSAGLWHGGLGLRTAWVGALIGALSLGVGLVAYVVGNESWQSMVFTTLAFAQVFQALGTRSTTASLWSVGPLSNRVLVAIAGLVVALQLAALYTPLSSFLGLDALDAAELGICVGLGAVVLVALECVKAVRRRVSARGAAAAARR